MESLNIIKGTSDKIINLPEKWIAYIDHGNGMTENLIVLDSQVKMMCWMERNLERRYDGYFHNGNRVLVKKTVEC